MKTIKIVHVVPLFPSKSETFIINHIVESLDYGFGSIILTDKKIPLYNSSQEDILEKHHLYNSAKETKYNIPENKLFRILKAIWLLLINFSNATIFFKTLNITKYKERGKSLKLWFLVARFLQFKNNKLFHAHFGVNGVLLAEMKELGAIRGDILVSFYGYDTFSTLETRENLKKTYAVLFKFASILLVSSKYLKKNLLLLNAPINKIELNYVGVNIDLFPFVKSKSKEVFDIITVGRLINLKGQKFGIKVLKELVDKNYNVHYHIVGDGDQKQYLDKLSKELNISKYVSMYGALSQGKIKRLLNSSDLFLMTSITDVDGRAEGQGLVIAEAKATGLPVIAFNSGGIKETILDDITGFLVPEKDIDTMVYKTESLINDFELREKVGIEGRIFIEKEFNSKLQSMKIIKLYQSLLVKNK